MEGVGAIGGGANDFWSKSRFDYATLPQRLMAQMGNGAAPVRADAR
jgi:hypothetical protein